MSDFMESLMMFGMFLFMLGAGVACAMFGYLIYMREIAGCVVR